MTCREASEFLLEYVSAELQADVRAEFDANCSRFVVQYQTTIAAGRIACLDRDENAADVLPEEVVRAILAAIAKGQP
jgi:hypothetical protein